MMLVIDTQYCENYGAHGWNGEGECPQHWKFKGGSHYKIVGIPSGVDLDEIVELARASVEHRDNYSEEYILGYSTQADDWMSAFEKSQLEYEGKIFHAEPTIDYTELNARYA